jgi:hypothetical protein
MDREAAVDGFAALSAAALIKTRGAAPLYVYCLQGIKKAPAGLHLQGLFFPLSYPSFPPVQTWCKTIYYYDYKNENAYIQVCTKYIHCFTLLTV